MYCSAVQYAHGLVGDQLHDGGVTVRDELGRVLGKLAGDVRSVAVQHRGVAVGNLGREWLGQILKY